MKTAHKIRMNHTPGQVAYLKRASGTRRFLYNWRREQWEKQYQAYKLEQETVPQEQRQTTKDWGKITRVVADAAMGHLLQFFKTKGAGAGGEHFLASRWFPWRHPLLLLWFATEMLRYLHASSLHGAVAASEVGGPVMLVGHVEDARLHIDCAQDQSSGSPCPGSCRS